MYDATANGGRAEINTLGQLLTNPVSSSEEFKMDNVIQVDDLLIPHMTKMKWQPSVCETIIEGCLAKLRDDAPDTNYIPLFLVLLSWTLSLTIKRLFPEIMDHFTPPLSALVPTPGPWGLVSPDGGAACVTS